MRSNVLVAAACAWAVWGAAGCRTHEVADCRPACTEADRVGFVACVAEGTTECAAGNRRCCALAARCLGGLEDQAVVSSKSCRDVTLPVDDTCPRPCIDMDQVLFDGCIDGGASACPTGEPECCALALDCAGELVIDEEESVEVWADGCCIDDLDCDEAESCDPSTWECAPDVSVGDCGDEILQPPEECDDGDLVTNACEYGMMSCEVCTEECVLGPGETSFCGDGEIDLASGEECEPPGTSACDDECFDLSAGDCFDGAANGDETDVDCGGSCVPCPPGGLCLVSDDCGTTPMPLCTSTAFCDPERGRCVELVCDDGDACTFDQCLATGGCMSIPIDADMDGFECAEDCDDADRAINPGVLDDGCDSLDNDCDFSIDEDC